MEFENIMTAVDETIVAKATAPGGAFRGIVRLSGPEALSSLDSLFEPGIRHSSLRQAVSGRLVPWGSRQPVPAKVFYWPQGRGYTGQETVEIHTIGSPPILDSLISKLCQNDQVRLARPGEFTLRAFLAGRLDLTQAEAVLGVIDAGNEKALKTALNQLAGGLASPLKQLRETLFETVAHLEARLDFAEEEIEFISLPQVRSILEEVLQGIEQLRHRMSGRGLAHEKPRIVLVGSPNVGKSTLFNALSGQDRAIVSPTAGTTRDYLETETSFDGLSCLLIDTAGFDETNALDRIDEAARHFSREALESADLILFCHEPETMPTGPTDPRQLDVRTKADQASLPEDSVPLAVSAVTGRGMDLLRRRIADRLRQKIVDSEAVPNTALRCRESLDQAVQSLERALRGLDSDETVFDEALLAGEIRIALNALGLVDGSVHTEDILDRIFSRFCIGK